MPGGDQTTNQTFCSRLHKLIGWKTENDVSHIKLRQKSLGDVAALVYNYDIIRKVCHSLVFVCFVLCVCVCVWGGGRGRGGCCGLFLMLLLLWSGFIWFGSNKVADKSNTERNAESSLPNYTQIHDLHKETLNRCNVNTLKGICSVASTHTVRAQKQAAAANGRKLNAGLGSLLLPPPPHSRPQRITPPPPPLLLMTSPLITDDVAPDY